ncbi:MAG TPA: hypothetical protein VLB51_09820 [Methylomirabilota bacterium]|nr:hypothetical protein [Methylomirabilota bacterium]
MPTIINQRPWWDRLLVGPKHHDVSAPDEIRAFFERHRRVLPAPRAPQGRIGG